MRYIFSIKFLMIHNHVKYALLLVIQFPGVKNVIITNKEFSEFHHQIVKQLINFHK